MNQLSWNNNVIFAQCLVQYRGNYGKAAINSVITGLKKEFVFSHLSLNPKDKMCKIEHGFKFCTCVKDASEPCEPGNKMPEYKWQLKRFAGHFDRGVTGTITGPSADLGRGITLPNVLAVLNSGNGFDFDYSPEENDSFGISLSDNSSGYRYMSFLFREGKWAIGQHAPFNTKTEEIAKGAIFNKGQKP